MAMILSLKTQETQGRVLNGMKLAFRQGMSARYIGALLGLSQQQAAAALFLLEQKGLVSRRQYGKGNTRWSLTDAGFAAEVG